jgi:hypothetical protein
MLHHFLLKVQLHLIHLKLNFLRFKWSKGLALVKFSWSWPKGLVGTDPLVFYWIWFVYMGMFVCCLHGPLTLTVLSLVLVLLIGQLVLIPITSKRKVWWFTNGLGLMKVMVFCLLIFLRYLSFLTVFAEFILTFIRSQLLFLVVLGVKFILWGRRLLELL